MNRVKDRRVEVSARTYTSRAVGVSMQMVEFKVGESNKGAAKHILVRMRLASAAGLTRQVLNMEQQELARQAEQRARNFNERQRELILEDP